MIEGGFNDDFANIILARARSLTCDDHVLDELPYAV